MAKKLTEETKAKLTYSCELGIFVIIFLVFGILRMAGVMGYKDLRRIIFNILTLCGGVWTITDFVLTLTSEKRRQKSCLLDKILVLPSGTFLIGFDIWCFINANKLANFEFLYNTTVGIIFVYFACIFTFEAIYHFYFPVPLMEQAIQEIEDDKDKEEAKEEAQVEQPLIEKEKEGVEK